MSSLINIHKLAAVLVAGFFCLSLSASEVIFVEAESFSSKGGWQVDQQFMDLMGSPYLLAHGMGVPVADASTQIEVPSEGVWNVWVRTFNWTSPWSDLEGPGAFKVRIGKKTLKTRLGTKGSGWMWQNAGSIRLKAGETELALCDLTGFEGRCDAICLTMDSEMTPPESVEELAAFRKQALGLGEAGVRSGYDFVVVGGGIAGMCAAVSAARLGSKVALINDRPVLGGNNSSEIRVHLGGHIELGPNKGLGRMIREFGHTKSGNAQPASNYEDEKKQQFIDAEENVTLFAPYRAVDVRMEGKKIEAVLIRHIETSEELWIEAPLFSDCTGDGTIGFLAGADYLMGREAASEYGESLAPETADKMTMGASVQWYSKKTDTPSAFPEFS